MLRHIGLGGIDFLQQLPHIFSSSHRQLMIFNRMGADITRNVSAANSNIASIESSGFFELVFFFIALTPNLGGLAF